jgi:uncharacterized protein YlaI
VYLIASITADHNVDCIIITSIVTIDCATFDSGNNLPTSYPIHPVESIAYSAADRNVDCIIITSIVTIECAPFDSGNNLRRSYPIHPVESIIYSAADRNVDCIIITWVVTIGCATFDSGNNLPTSYFYCHESWAHLPTSILSITVGGWVQVPDPQTIGLVGRMFNSQQQQSGKQAVIGGQFSAST